MLVNYVNEEFLKGFIPELANYLWTGETNYNKQKQSAEQVVVSDFINKGYKIRDLMPRLYLRTSTDSVIADENGAISDEDIASRLRLCVEVDALATPVTLTLQGTNDEGTNYYDITTVTPTATGTTSSVFHTAYEKYRINTNVTSSSITYQAWLVETNFDLFFAYKWLELILFNAGKGQDNKFTEFGKYFQEQYKQLWATGIIWEDTQHDNEITSSNKQSIARVRFGR